MIRSRALALAALAIVALPISGAQAQVAKAKPAVSAYDRCLAIPAGQTTAGMIECASAELAIQDARLNRAYQAAILRLERPRQKTALQKAQRAWMAFRDADCASYYDEDWGSIARVQANACVLDQTIRRANDLEAFHRGF
ncbi:lysozyme inhibitor LprI family protein [Caulobacter sp.]|uniref:lysozyme inhibitor LprI family protein n=1 Tax=Caulobacter sp. TaxID=78 RepID=UPI003BAC3463